jgi:hypothetical protein
MIGYARIREWHVAIDSKSYVNTVVRQLEMFDSKFATYQLAFGDAPLKMEENETVTTLPIVEGQLGPLESRVHILRLLVLESMTTSLL